MKSQCKRLLESTWSEMSVQLVCGAILCCLLHCGALYLVALMLQDLSQNPPGGHLQCQLCIGVEWNVSELLAWELIAFFLWPKS